MVKIEESENTFDMRGFLFKRINDELSLAFIESKREDYLNWSKTLEGLHRDAYYMAEKEDQEKLDNFRKKMYTLLEDFQQNLEIMNKTGRKQCPTKLPFLLHDYELLIRKIFNEKGVFG